MLEKILYRLELRPEALVQHVAVKLTVDSDRIRLERVFATNPGSCEEC